MARDRRPYFFLAVRDDAMSPWVVEFGDFSFNHVEAEQADWLDHTNEDGSRRRLSQCEIIKCGPTTIEMEAALADLNRRAAA